MCLHHRMYIPSVRHNGEESANKLTVNVLYNYVNVVIKKVVSIRNYKFVSCILPYSTSECVPRQFFHMNLSLLQ